VSEPEVAGVESLFQTPTPLLF